MATVLPQEARRVDSKNCSLSLGRSCTECLKVQEMGSNRALVLTTLDGPAIEDVNASYFSAESGRPLEAAAPAVDVSIVDTGTLMTQDVAVEGALIYVRVTEQEPKANFMCAYMAGPDFTVWSTQGVRLATEAELADLALQMGSSKLSGTWCATEHLSIFGVFLDILLDCTWLGSM